MNIIFLILEQKKTGIYFNIYCPCKDLINTLATSCLLKSLFSDDSKFFLKVRASTCDNSLSNDYIENDHLAQYHRRRDKPALTTEFIRSTDGKLNKVQLKLNIYFQRKKVYIEEEVIMQKRNINKIS